MVSVEKIQKGIAAYLDDEMMPQFPGNGLEKVIAGTAMSLAIRRSGDIMENLKNNKGIQMLGIVGKDGTVDIDALSEELKKNIPVDGVKVEVPFIGNMTFRKADVDKLTEYITEA